MKDFNKKCETYVVSDRVINEFIATMISGWHTNDLIKYIDQTFDYNKLNTYSNIQHITCIDILKEYLIAVAIGDINIQYFNIQQHQLLISIFRFVKDNGYLPKLENIV